MEEEQSTWQAGYVRVTKQYQQLEIMHKAEVDMLMAHITQLGTLAMLAADVLSNTEHGELARVLRLTAAQAERLGE